MPKTKLFIDKARAKHGDRYGYDRVDYVRSKDNVFINCTKHGYFEQTPKGHLKGYGCASCGRASSAIKQSQEAKDNFIKKARAVHGDRYDYGRTVYVRNGDKVTITCRSHGDYDQVASSHLRGKGCAKCSRTYAYSTQEWIQKAVDVHGDKYDYGHIDYTGNSKDKVTITCKKHGYFEQIANDHLSGSGCPSCPRRYNQPTNLYLMRSGAGKVKVGYSIDTDRRISQLNKLAPFSAELLETWTIPDTPTARKIEGEVHRKLAKYHAGLSGFDGATEWFNTSPEVAKAVIMKSLA